MSTIHLALKQVGLFELVPAAAWKRDWTIDSVVVGDGRGSLKYLAPYVFRGPVSNWRVTECCWSEPIDNAKLVLQVKRSGTNRYRGMPLTVIEFLRRWLQHVLPSGLHRVRHDGFLNSHSKRSLQEVRWLIAVANHQLHYLACGVEFAMAATTKMACPQCGGAMICLGYTPPPPPPAGRITFSVARAPPNFVTAGNSV